MLAGTWPKKWKYCSSHKSPSEWATVSTGIYVSTMPRQWYHYPVYELHNQEDLLRHPGCMLRCRHNFQFNYFCVDVIALRNLLYGWCRLSHFERQENKEINKELLTTEDFGIVIKDLPEQMDYNSSKELKALLWNHMERVLAQESQCISQLEKSSKSYEVVNIHFGMSNYSKLKILFAIYNGMKEILRVKSRM